MYVRAEKPTRFVNRNDIDIHSNKKLRFGLTAISLAVAIILAAIANFFIPITTFYDVAGVGQLVFALVIVVAEMVVYYVLHEYLHSVISKKYTGKRSRIVMEKSFSYSVIKGYYSVNSYLYICFFPIVILGIVLLVLSIVLPEKLFWYVFFVQIINIAGATGDCYVAIRLLKVKKELVVEDNGLVVTYWTK